MESYAIAWNVPIICNGWATNNELLHILPLTIHILFRQNNSYQWLEASFIQSKNMLHIQEKDNVLTFLFIPLFLVLTEFDGDIIHLNSCVFSIW